MEKEKEAAESVRKISMERWAETRENESKGCGEKRRKMMEIGKQLIISGEIMIENSMLRGRSWN